MRLLPAGVLCIAGAALTGGCANKECYDNQNSLPLAGFFSSELPGRALSLDSVSIFGLGAPRDSLLADSASGLTEVYLPFRNDAPTTTFVFRYDGLHGAMAPDTVTFRYNTQPWFVSEACGVIYRYHIEGIDHTRHLIDSVVCPEGVITNAPGRNINIYFRTYEDL